MAYKGYSPKQKIKALMETSKNEFLCTPRFKEFTEIKKA